MHKKLSLKQYTERPVVCFFWENENCCAYSIIVKLMKQLLIFFQPKIWSQIQDISYLDVKYKDITCKTRILLIPSFLTLISYITSLSQNIQPHKHTTCLFITAPTTNNYSTLNKVHKIPRHLHKLK